MKIRDVRCVLSDDEKRVLSLEAAPGQYEGDQPTSIKIDNVEYVRKDSVSAAPADSKRCVVVVDKGWIYAGDVEDCRNGRIRIHNALWLFRWETIGFDGVLRDPKNAKVSLRPLGFVVDLPALSEIFRVPVQSDWGR